MDSLDFELFERAARIYKVHARLRSYAVAGFAAIGIGALAIAPTAPPPQPHAPPVVSSDVQLTAAPALGAIPLAFIRNQFQYCSLICPFAVQGAIAVPVAAAQVPATFLGSLASTGSPLRAFGAAAASVTGPANVAVTPLINNDVFLVVPKAFHALDVAVVEAVNVGIAALTPAQFLQAVQSGRTNILSALNQPVGAPTTPTGASNIVQVVAVSAIDVTTAVAFQAGELLLAGVVQTADAAAQELARSGDPAAAFAAGATRAGQVLSTASAPVASAVDTAVTTIRRSPPSVGSVHAVGGKPRLKPTLAAGAGQTSSKDSSTTGMRSGGSSNDKATPRAKKNTMKSGPPR
jgi:hypothetical protein